MMWTTRKAVHMSDLYSEMSRQTNRTPRLRIDEIMDSMEDDDKQSLLAALNDRGVQNQRISQVLSERGWPISWHAVKNWRMRNVAK
jgi:hypothetical protein